MVMKQSNSYILEDKLFISMLCFTIFLSLVSIAGNLMIGLSFGVNYKWITLILISLLALKYTLKKQYVVFFQALLSSLVIFIFLPNGWLTSGGTNNLTSAYLFLICISVCFIFHGKLRLFFIVSEVTVLLLLFGVEFYYPQLIYKQSVESQFFDMLIQMPLTLSAAAYIVIIFSNAYSNERKVLKEYAQRLQESNEKLIILSQTDELTGVFNRRYIFERLEQLRSQMKESGSTAFIIMIDIDNFKTINDNYGHAFGDELLKRVSSHLKMVIKEKGFIGRYGGDEFIIILENVGIMDAKSIVKHIKDELGHIYSKDGLGITVSGGMVQLTKHDDIDEVLLNADKLLYTVKENSKNNILFENDF